MKWTTQRPTKAGVYWWKLDLAPLICEVYWSRRALFVQFMGCKPLPLSQMDEMSEWQGPITPQEDAT